MFWTRVSISIAFVSFALVVAFPVRGQDIEELEESAVRAVVTDAEKSLVRFETIGGLSRVDGAIIANGVSTGLAISEDGFALSASFNFAHEPASIFARLPNGNRASAEIVGRDLSRKLVLLKIQTDFEFEVLPVANSDSVRVGETAVAVGRVLSTDSTNVSTGIISAKNRVWDRAIQTDAKISPANFGGPLLTLTGEVIGILVPLSPDDDSELAGAEWYDSGIGFAVTLDSMEKRIQQMKQGMTLRKGLLGVSLKGSDVFADPAEVAFCRGSSPAGKSGIVPGDRIVEINGRPIRRQSELKHALGGLYEQDIAQIMIRRGEERKRFEVELAGEIEPFVPTAMGVLIDEDELDGLLINHVAQGSPADAAGLRAGDRIERVANEKIDSKNELRWKLAATEVSSRLVFEIARANKSESVPLSIGKQNAALLDSELNFQPAESVKSMQIVVAEVPNACVAVVPESTSRTSPPGLLVWIPEPGAIEEVALFNLWKEASLQLNVIVLVPQSTDEKAWSPDDLDFVVSAVDGLRKRIEFDPDKVVVAGSKTGGVMASILAFGQRDLFRGLALIDSNLSRRLRQIETSPVEPMLVLFGLSTTADNQQKASIDQLQSAHFPVHVEHLEGNSFANWAALLLKWTRTVDRL